MFPLLLERWARIYRSFGTLGHVHWLDTNRMADANGGTTPSQMENSGNQSTNDAMEALIFICEVEGFRFEKQAIQFRVEFLILNGHLQNIECAVGGDGLLIRPVGSGEGVENIARGNRLARQCCKAIRCALACAIARNAYEPDARGSAHKPLQGNQVACPRSAKHTTGVSPSSGAEFLLLGEGAGSTRTAYRRLKGRVRGAARECSKYQISARCRL